MERPFERVYTVNDFYDYPRAGFADFDGAPHVYRSIWEDQLEDFDQDERFALRPVATDILALAVEGWEIWRRWEEAYYAGLTSKTKHPALPEDFERHRYLAPLIERALEIDVSEARIVFGRFRGPDGARGGVGIPTSRAQLEVRWTPIESVPPAV
jgi:hypothetical protein